MWHYRSTRARDSLSLAIAKNDKKNVLSHNGEISIRSRENRSNRREHRSGGYEFPNPSGGYSRNLRSATHADHIVGITDREAEIESSLSLPLSWIWDINDIGEKRIHRVRSKRVVGFTRMLKRETKFARKSLKRMITMPELALGIGEKLRQLP